MAGEERGGRWVIRPSAWFDAVCLIPLLAGMPFYTSRHEQDARWWQERFGWSLGPKPVTGCRCCAVPTPFARYSFDAVTDPGEIVGAGNWGIDGDDGGRVAWARFGG
jgi:hypothetical protein